MLNLLRDWLVQQGLGGQTAAFVTTAVEIALVITLTAIADIVARRIILRQLEKLVGQTSTVWDDIIVKRRVFHRLLHLAPALVIYVFAQPVLVGYDLWIVVVRRASLIYMLLVTLLAIDGVLNAGVDILRSSKFSRNLPVKVVVQVLKLVLYSVATIALISLIHRAVAQSFARRSRRDDCRSDAESSRTRSWDWSPASSSPRIKWWLRATGSRCRSTAPMGTCWRSH